MLKHSGMSVGSCVGNVAMSYFLEIHNLLIYLNLCGFMVSHFIHCAVFLMLTWALTWPVGAPCAWTWCPVDQSPTFFEHLLVFWPNFPGLESDISPRAL
jgi:hypothetical protein